VMVICQIALNFYNLLLPVASRAGSPAAGTGAWVSLTVKSTLNAHLKRGLA
jgi:hypothetical protein